MNLLDNNMNLGGYLKTLPSFFSKKDLVLDLEHQYEMIEVTIQPMLELALNLSNAGYLKAEDRLDSELNKKIDLDEFNVVEKLNKASTIILENKADLIKLINETVDKGVVRDTADYKQINLLQYLECVNYFITYTKHWISYYQYQMLLASGNKKVSPDLLKLPMWKINTEFVAETNRMSAFIGAVNLLIKPIDDIRKKLKNLEGHLVNPDEWSNAYSASNTDKLNPLKVNNFGVTFNPFYHLGLIWNAWMNKRNEENKADLVQLQMTVLYLQEVNSSTEDPERKERLEKQIRYNSNRINDLANSIRKYEGDD